MNVPMGPSSGFAHKLILQLFVRHASELAITEGSTVKDHYNHVSEHFYRKTGFGQ